MLCLVAQSCPTPCDLMDYSLPGSSVHGESPSKHTGEGCHALLQGIFPTQGSNPGLRHCRWTPYRLSHQGSPRILEWVSYPFSRKLLTKKSNRGLLHCRWILYQLSYQGSPYTHYYIENRWLIRTYSISQGTLLHTLISYMGKESKNGIDICVYIIYI